MPAILGALGALLMNLLRQYGPGIVGRILLTLGIGFTAYKFALPAMVSVLSGYINQLPVFMRAYFGALGLDVAAVIIISALIAVRTQRLMLSRVGGSA